MQEFRPPELKAYLEQSNEPPLLIDVREPWEHRVAPFEGARLVPMRQVPALLDELDRETELVMICHHGIRSRQAGRFLEQHGFGRVINLAGGIDAWAREIDPNVPLY
ncbi:MAG: rhodanese-like domain-containing protein [Chromatiales bacterium]|jgi:rhodanese-related sulfurtransferase